MEKEKKIREKNEYDEFSISKVDKTTWNFLSYRYKLRLGLG